MDARVAKFIRRVVPAHWRPIRYLENLARKQTGGRVAAGPFAGMHYITSSVGSAYVPKLLGSYERELAGCIEEICATGPDRIVDVGSAEGYYAVGMALRNPAARIIAFELEERGRRMLVDMARLNDVSIEVHGECDLASLELALIGADQALVICDAEGAEMELLDPTCAPALLSATILVELHEFLLPGVGKTLQERFAQSHSISQIWQQPRSRRQFPYTDLYTKLLPRSYLDWAVSEWRPERMSWLWMKPDARRK